MVEDEYANGVRILFHTSMGDITIQLRNDMPITTNNFKNLVEQGKYNGTIFHRVISGFMIQGGDPTGTGYGDPSIPYIKDEFTRKNHNYKGTIAMANAGPNTGSSQFFINVVDNNYLDTKHPQFGKVVSGMDVVDAITKVRASMEDRPFKNVTIINASILS
jgi:peptidylprolyl isomerase